MTYVVALARHMSFTKAAEELGIAQPTLTRSIQSLEAHAKTRLFDRDRGGVHLTPIGRDFVRRAAAVLADVRDIERMLDQAASAHAGEVAFGMAPLPARALLPTVLLKAFAERPGLSCKVAVRSVDALLSLLSSEEIEFFLCAEGLVPNSIPLKRRSLGTFPTSFLVRAGHPLLSRDSGDKGATYPLIHSGFFASGYRMPSQIARSLQGSIHVVEDYEVLRQITENTDAIWFSSAFAAIDEIREGALKVLPLYRQIPSIQFQMVMFTPEKRSLSPAARELKAMCQQTIEGLAQSLHGMMVG